MERIETFEFFMEKLVDVLIDKSLEGRDKNRQINFLYTQLNFKLSQDHIDKINIINSLSHEELLNLQKSNFVFEEKSKVTEENRKKSSSKPMLIILAVFLGLTLPFHWVIDNGFIPIDVFPKDNITFSYTFITKGLYHFCR
jgi:hypothetical protein